MLYLCRYYRQWSIISIASQTPTLLADRISPIVEPLHEAFEPAPYRVGRTEWRRTLVSRQVPRLLGVSTALLGSWGSRTLTTALAEKRFSGDATPRQPRCCRIRRHQIDVSRQDPVPRTI